VDGGETKLDNLVLLCRRHHRAVHELGFRVECDCLRPTSLEVAISCALDRGSCARQIHVVGHTITIRLTRELATWLEQTAARAGVSQGRIIREQLEKVMSATPDRSFMGLAGSIRGSSDLSQRKGFAKGGARK